ncbi:hypothetical protein [Streptacidiphilus sp. MAP12-33]|uniref:hypothetical protein n=1 Tax=Streptacidiphilus sp. MAP12-33 TaxID=3156266 RepID=UPI0035178626
MAFDGHEGQVRALAAFDEPSGRPLLTIGGSDGVVTVWDPLTGEPVGEPLQGHRGAVTSLIAFVGPQDQVLLATGGKDRNLRVWDAHTRQCVLRIVTSSPLNALFAVRGDRAGASGLLVGATAGFALIDVDVPA